MSDHPCQSPGELPVETDDGRPASIMAVVAGRFFTTLAVTRGQLPGIVLATVIVDPLELLDRFPTVVAGVTAGGIGVCCIRGCHPVVSRRFRSPKKQCKVRQHVDLKQSATSAAVAGRNPWNPGLSVSRHAIVRADIVRFLLRFTG